MGRRPGHRAAHHQQPAGDLPTHDGVVGARRDVRRGGGHPLGRRHVPADDRLPRGERNRLRDRDNAIALSVYGTSHNYRCTGASIGGQNGGRGIIMWE